MSRHFAVLTAQEVQSDEPTLSWPPSAANDPVVLSLEPFDGALRTSPPAVLRASNRWRLSGLVAAAGVMAIIAAVATIVIVGRYSSPDARLSTTAALVTITPKSAASVTIHSGERGNAGDSAELAMGLSALRSQMQAAAHASEATATPHVSIASAEEPSAGGQPITEISSIAVSAPNQVAPTVEAAAPKIGLSVEAVSAMLDRAKRLIAVGDIAAARRLAEYAASGDNGNALFALAETFDPKQLARWHVRGVRADIERARDLYRQALQRGVADAQTRLAALP